MLAIFCFKMEGSWWAKLHVPLYKGANVPQVIRDALRTWFYTHPPSASDFVAVDFDAHVRCFYISSTTTDSMISIDMATLSPITDAFVLFYTFDDKLKQLYLWGGLPFTTLDEYGGELKFDFIKQHQTRSFVMRSVVELEKPLAFVDMHPVQLLTSEPFNSIHPSELKDMDIDAKLHFYLSSPPQGGTTGGSGGLSYSCPAAEQACIGYALELSYDILYHVRRGIFGDFYDGRVLCNKFRQMIVTAELKLLYDRLYKNFQNEEDLMRLVGEMSLPPPSAGGGATCLDEQAFCKMYTHANVLIPKYWLTVPMESVPTLVQLPLYEQGTVHLPVYWEAIYEWLACRFRCAVQQHFNRERTDCVRRILNREQSDVNRIIKYIMTEKPVAVPVSFSDKESGNAAEIDSKHGTFVSDIEDIWSSMPPCMRNLRNKGRFPRNGERLYLIPAMWQGGYSMAAIDTFLSALNDKWPKSPAETVAKRANPASLIRANRGIHWCSNVIKHTLSKRDDALHCPFVGPDSTTADACGAKCAESLSLRYPVKAPYKVIEYNVKRMAGRKVEAPLPPAAGAAAEDDSSSSVSFDEELEHKKRRKHLKVEIEMEKEMEK
jgi:hypothetical protein